MSAPARSTTTVGILGGGQLARMLALSGAPLGLRFLVMDTADDACAGQFAPLLVGDYRDETALAEFAGKVDVATFDFENVPAESAHWLAERVPVFPNPDALALTQDRLAEKTLFRELGIPVPDFADVATRAQLDDAVARIGTPCILKTRRLGYDGKGQVKLTGDVAPVDAWKSIGGVDAIVEGFVDFALEVSVIVARGQDGAMAAYPAVENRHANHILDETIAPAAVAPEIADEAGRIACRIAEALQFVGVLAVEMFVTRDGAVLVNELAPRPHNSGHWTIDACAASQFEQLVRAVCGLPLGSVERTADAVMKNLIGSDADRWPELLAEPGARLHLYGKAEARPGRKMGHVTRLVPFGSAAGT